MSPHPWLLAGICLLLIHEMDAVRLREWRLFPGLNRLNDDLAYLVFTLLHVPLYLLLFFALFGQATPNPLLITVLSTFFIVHLGLHLKVLRHPDNEFRNVFSWFLIGGTALCGALELLI